MRLAGEAEVASGRAEELRRLHIEGEVGGRGGLGGGRSAASWQVIHQYRSD